jgi:HEPN domain-containing protein
MNLMGVEPHDDAVHGLLEGVLAEFESAARQLLRPEDTGRASALWTMQMAVERVLKAYAQHKLGTYRQIHNLFELYDDIAAHGIDADRDLLKKLPRDRDVMSDRYGLRGTPSLLEAFDAYRAALSFVGSISGKFAHKYYVGGAGFLLRKPSWTTLPSTIPKE